jgi:hypothetical protein
MRRGVWHQFGDRSQKLVQEQLEHGNGVGVIISPRDLSLPNAIHYADIYHDLEAEVLVDLQFYNPQFHNNTLESYPANEFRVSVSDLCQIKDNQLRGLADSLRVINGNLRSSAILSPALLYEAGRNDLIDLNSRLFSVAKQVGDDLGIPTYATVLIGRSASISESVISTLLSSATALNSDGWYFGYEFNQNRIPSNFEDILRFGSSLLTLACTGKPVLHSFAGPMSLLSMGFGATGAAIGHSQNLWQFTRGRWELSTGSQGGGGDAPPRYFSQNLWGTFVYPDELVQLPISIRERLLSPSPFSVSLDGNSPLPWSRWEANKHLLFIIGQVVSQLSQTQNAIDCAVAAIDHLENSERLSNDIESFGLTLRDDTCCYQANWKQALVQGIERFRGDYDYLSLLSS